MQKTVKLIAALFAVAAVLFAAIVLLGFRQSHKQEDYKSPVSLPKAKIQVALLLDVSNSMDGLIDQAKAQLWNTVNLLGKATREGQNPPMEFALYEFGRSSNPANDGYIRKINGFISDLDSLSVNLFKLSTNGGDEYCGKVMLSSLEQLVWDTSMASYKVIFIAGNESFRQGSVSYIKACTEARRMGVTINTIYCGSREEGIREFWNLGAECSQGSFTNINQDARPNDPPTPYDTVLFALNNKLNTTYIGYGSKGTAYIARQSQADAFNYALAPSVGAKRVMAKGKSNVYNNADWDLVDAMAEDASVITKVDRSSLPDSLQNRSNAELEQLVRAKQMERTLIRQEIATASNKREVFIANARKQTASQNAPTLETEMEKILKEQAARYRMEIR